MYTDSFEKHIFSSTWRMLQLAAVSLITTVSSSWLTIQRQPRKFVTYLAIVLKSTIFNLIHLIIDAMVHLIFNVVCPSHLIVIFQLILNSLNPHYPCFHYPTSSLMDMLLLLLIAQHQTTP